MDSKKNSLLNAWDYIEKEYSIPSIKGLASTLSTVIGLPIPIPDFGIGSKSKEKKLKIAKEEKKAKSAARPRERAEKKEASVSKRRRSTETKVKPESTDKPIAKSTTRPSAKAAKKAAPPQKRAKLNKDMIPNDVFKNECALFYTKICQYCDERNITESDLYNRARVSRAVFSNIRGMALNSYVPSKLTIVCLCIALHLDLAKAQELLAILGYSLSNNLIVDKAVAWCLEQQDTEFDVDSINDVIYEKTNGEYCLLKAS